MAGRKRCKVLHFTRLPVRYIVLREVSKDRWQATYNDDGGNLVFSTQVGEQWLVLQAVSHPERRRGLPIITVPAPWLHAKERAA